MRNLFLAILVALSLISVPKVGVNPAHADSRSGTLTKSLTQSMT
jgi:hypothetical protein